MKKITFILCCLFMAGLSYMNAQESAIHFNAKLVVQEGQMDKFKEVAKLCIAAVKEHDTGTLQYDWFIDEKSNTCIVRETYKNSQAVLEHMANVSELLPQLLEISTPTLEVFGTPSEELQTALAAFGPSVYPLYKGLE